MRTPIEKPELLAPAGNFEKLEIALHYGADAVYLAGKQFSLRNFSGNFSDDQLFDAVAYTHDRGKKVYLACNVYFRNDEEKALAEYLDLIGRIRPDAVILSDPGAIALAGQIIPDIDIHLSTQANTTHAAAARFWHALGIKRVNLARELSLEEIRQVSQGPVPTEVFVHGAMCISYSGRCLLSSFLTNRDANRGQCSHPCRWKYQVIEEQRPDLRHPVEEDEQGSYIFNSKDLCMIRHIPELMTAGIASFKIEGRMKGINYLASVVKTYREAIDRYALDPVNYQPDPVWEDELSQIFHRDYCTGFFFGHPDEQCPNYKNRHRGKIHSFIGKITGHTPEGRPLIQIRNRLQPGDRIEVISPGRPPATDTVADLVHSDGHSIKKADPNTTVSVGINLTCDLNDIVRKK